MFRRKWEGLPKDVSFASDLKGLGRLTRYFVNDEDEVRSIEDPDYYFKFFLSRNPRINLRQRFEFNGALENIIHSRIEDEGLQRMALPLKSTFADPHVPIYVSPNLKEKSRLVVFFGEPTQELGVLAFRVVNGKGGIDRGSLVSFIREIQAQKSTASDNSPPGIILANVGQLYWWPEGERAITITGSAAIPLPSLAHTGRKYVPALNDIPGNESPDKHVASVFAEILGTMAKSDTLVDIVAIGQSCETVERFLDNESNWARWGNRLNSMVLIAPVHGVELLQNANLKKFLQERTRGYMVPSENVLFGSPLASPAGNSELGIPPLGCPCYASSETQHTEMILIRDLSHILLYTQEVALTRGYRNKLSVAVERPSGSNGTTDGVPWEEFDECQKPSISVTDPQAIYEAVCPFQKSNSDGNAVFTSAKEVSEASCHW